VCDRNLKNEADLASFGLLCLRERERERERNQRYDMPETKEIKVRYGEI
jgi:hypothetical protein